MTKSQLIFLREPDSGAGGRRERLFVGDWILMSAVDRLLPFLLSPHFVDPSHDHPSPTQQSALLSSIQLCHTSSGHCSAFIKFNTCLTKASWSNSVERWMCFQNPNMSVPLLIVPPTFANIPCNYGWAGSCLAWPDLRFVQNSRLWMLRAEDRPRLETGPDPAFSKLVTVGAVWCKFGNCGTF